MKQEQCITVKQAVVELYLFVSILFAVCFFDTIISVIKIFIHLGRHKEVWNDVISFRHIITKPNARLRYFATIEDVKIPLDDISCICVLFVDGF